MGSAAHAQAGLCAAGRGAGQRSDRAGAPEGGRTPRCQSRCTLAVCPDFHPLCPSFLPVLTPQPHLQRVGRRVHPRRPWRHDAHHREEQPRRAAALHARVPEGRRPAPCRGPALPQPSGGASTTPASPRARASAARTRPRLVLLTALAQRGAAPLQAGNAGHKLTDVSHDQEPWLEYAAVRYGYGRVTVNSGASLLFEMVGEGEGRRPPAPAFHSQRPIVPALLHRGRRQHCLTRSSPEPPSALCSLARAAAWPRIDSSREVASVGIAPVPFPQPFAGSPAGSASPCCTATQLPDPTCGPSLAQLQMATCTTR